MDVSEAHAPLSDALLETWLVEQSFVAGLVRGGLPTVIDQVWLVRTGELIAEVRASRARERLLRERIDDALSVLAQRFQWCFGRQVIRTELIECALRDAA